MGGNKLNFKLKFITIIKLSLLYFFVGCAPKVYNTPFVDTKETLKLKYGLPKSQVLELLGKPLYVEYGNEKTSEIIWVYEVRARKVQSEILISGEVKPSKNHSDAIIGDPINRLNIVFVNDKINRWESVEIKKTESQLEEKSKKKKSFYFHPTIAMESITFSAYHHDNSGSYRTDHNSKRLVFGSNFGLTTTNYRFGIDSRLWFNSVGMMFTFEKLNLINGFNVLFGGGLNGNFDLVGEDENGHTGYAHEYLQVGKIGISKSLNFSGKQISVRLESLIGENELNSTIMLAYHLRN